MTDDVIIYTPPTNIPKSNAPTSPPQLTDVTLYIHKTITSVQPNEKHPGMTMMTITTTFPIL